MKYLFPILFILPFLSSCSWEGEILIQKSYKTFTTWSGDLTVTDTIIAPVEWSLTSDLSFKTNGRIGEVLVRPGDEVKKGQVLARLTNQEGIITYDGLGNVMENIGSIERTTTTMRNNTVEMRNATSKLYDERIRQAQNSIKNLEISLLQAKKNLTNQTDTLDSNYRIHVNAFLKLADSMIYEGDKILGISTNFEFSNDAWDPYLGLRLGNIKTEAHNSWGRLYGLRGELLAQREKKVIITPENAETEIKFLSDSFKELGYFAMTMGNMLENSVIGGDLSEERLNGWVNAWTAFKANEQAAESNFAAWRDAAKNLITSGSGGASVASMSIETLVTDLENTRKNIDVLKAEKESKLREINVNLSQIDGKSAELALQFSETAMNRFLASESIEWTLITAPYDGVILEKYFDVGNMIQAGAPLFQITSNDVPTIKTYIDNYIYAYKKWDTVTLKNTYSKASFTGSISLIQSEKDPLHNKNYTEIIIPWYSGSLGERMDVELTHREKSLENGIIIPLSSIVTRYGPPGVFVVDADKTARFMMVEILGSDMQYAEVLGIPKNSVIITDGKENMIDGEDLSKN